MLKLYIELVRSGERTIESIPKKFQEAVRKALEPEAEE